MAFIVRTVARTADGRDIIRPKSFARHQLTIGRGTENDIHLADLAVTLHHAIVRDLGHGMVEIAATAGLPFHIDGKQSEQAEVNAEAGATVRMGSHTLAITAGEGDQRGQVIITIERVGTISNSADEKEEAKVFSLASVIPGRRPLSWALALLVLGLFLVWPLVSIHMNKASAKPTDAQMRPIGFHADEMWSSGKLSKVHAGLENNCKACHVDAGVSVRDDACVACHTSVHDHSTKDKLQVAMGDPGVVGKAKGLVAAAFNRPPGRCVECHTEHEGATAMPTTDERFCTNCHTGMKERLTSTPLKDVSDFGTGHPEFSPGVRMVSAAGVPMIERLSLATAPKENNGLKFPHDMHLSTTNGVARMAQTLGAEGYGKPLECANCHRRDSTGSSFVAVDMKTDCAACHSLDFEQVGGTIRTLRHGDPAQVVADIRAFYRSGANFGSAAVQGMARRRPGDFGSRIAAVDYAQGQISRGGNADSTIRAVFSKGGACFDCHVIKPTGSAQTPFAVTPVVLAKRYMTKGWFDHGAHATETCASCHGVAKSASATDVNLPKIARCQECHGGQDAKKEVPSACAMCHDYHRTGFAPAQVRSSRVRGKVMDRVTETTARAAAKGV
jgi:hypothetical protein